MTVYGAPAAASTVGTAKAADVVLPDIAVGDGPIDGCDAPEVVGAGLMAVDVWPDGI